MFVEGEESSEFWIWWEFDCSTSESEMSDVNGWMDGRTSIAVQCWHVKISDSLNQFGSLQASAIKLDLMALGSGLMPIHVHQLIYLFTDVKWLIEDFVLCCQCTRGSR